MSVRAEQFRAWMIARGHPATTIGNYVSNIRTVDAVIDGVDESAAADGGEKTMARLEAAISGGAVTYPSDRRSALKKYLEFTADPLADSVAQPSDDLPTEVEAQSYLFRFEREMQSAVRRQLSAIEPGLKAIDDGQETQVATGKIDILARDASDRLVVIELKAGPCPSSALEQVLGYSDDVEREQGEAVRSMLVASSFSDRTRAAARRVVGLELHAYDYVLTFEKVGQS